MTASDSPVDPADAPSGEYTTVAKADDIPPGKSGAFPVNGRMVAVFHDAEGFHAIDDFCPHMGASLAGGHVEDGVVSCPWHAWRFSVKDGTWCDNPRIQIDSFPIRVQDGEIQVLVPSKPTGPDAASDSCTPPEPPESSGTPDNPAS